MAGTLAKLGYCNMDEKLGRDMSGVEGMDTAALTAVAKGDYNASDPAQASLAYLIKLYKWVRCAVLSCCVACLAYLIRAVQVGTLCCAVGAACCVRLGGSV